jgi:predicted CxxxxCH...CXXCH cytochrome family protein
MDTDTINATGSHTKHAQGAVNLSCGTCHNGYGESSVDQATHNNSSINLGFSGQASGTDYSQGNSHILGNGYGTCSSSACHSSGQNPDDGLTGALSYGTPTWGGTLDCGSCHRNMDTDAVATGSHTKHTQGTVNIQCSICHNGYTETTVNAGTHNNASINLSFSGRANGTGYSQGATHDLGNGYGTCSANYCHSNVQGTGGIGAPTSYATPTWGVSVMNCGTCHANMAGGSATGSHTKHMGSSAAMVSGCSDCHVGAANDGSAYSSTLHANQSVDVVAALN